MTPPTGKSCFVFVFALRACVRDATRDQGVVQACLCVPPPRRPASRSDFVLTMMVLLFLFFYVF